MATINRKGYAQVELNHMSAQKTGQIYAQLPATGITQLEQGQFLKYDYVEGKASVDGDGEWLLVYNEEKHYDERKPYHKDFCLKASDFTDKVIYPRLFKTNVGDIYTTNAFGGAAAADDAEVAGAELTVKDFVSVGADGWLKKGELADEGPVFQVVKVYTMPDGQPGVKLQRIK